MCYPDSPNKHKKYVSSEQLISRSNSFEHHEIVSSEKAKDFLFSFERPAVFKGRDTDLAMKGNFFAKQLDDFFYYYHVKIFL